MCRKTLTELMVWGLCPSSVVCRPCRNYLRTYWADSFQISAVAPPGEYPQRYFEFVKKKCIFKFFRIFFFFFVFLLTMLTWNPMGPMLTWLARKNEKKWNPSLTLLAKWTSMWSLTFVVPSLMWPMGAKISKRYSSLKSLLNLLKLFLNFLLSGPDKSTVWIFEILSFWFFTIFFSR